VRWPDAVPHAPRQFKPVALAEDPDGRAAAGEGAGARNRGACARGLGGEALMHVQGVTVVGHGVSPFFAGYTSGFPRVRNPEAKKAGR